ncbi:MAG: NUMOD4 domain-containing protein [Erysipelotrichaceae bacterium]
MERFTNIPGFERYSVGDQGTIINKTTGCTIKPRSASNGYLRVGLRKGDRKNEKPTTLSVHRLVAENYVDGYSIDKQVNHIDGIKANNAAINLEWCYPVENIGHAIRTGLMIIPDKESILKRLQNDEVRTKSIRSHRTKKYRDKMQSINAQAGLTHRVSMIDQATGRFLMVFDNCTEAARKLFGDKYLYEDRLIARAARGKAKSAYGYVWQYD